MPNHQPIISQCADSRWVVECVDCRNDRASAVPIGIGIPLKDKETAERLWENHRARSLRAAASY